MDYLPVQATSVPSERVFSSASDTDMKKHNRISPELMEALQLLKFMYRTAELDFTTGWISTERGIVSVTNESKHDELAELFVENATKKSFDQLLVILANDNDEEDLPDFATNTLVLEDLPETDEPADDDNGNESDDY